MSRIASVFVSQSPEPKLRAEGVANSEGKANHKAFISYVTVGYPSIEMTLRAVPLLAEGGCDIVELGIPFSDPLADGTTIQKASFQALQNGVTPQVCFEVAKELRKRTEIPLIFMTYFNPILNYGGVPSPLTGEGQGESGLCSFCAACVNSGIDGIIVPDLPPEEGSELELVARNHGLDLIYLLAPTSSDERIRLISQRSSGFIYLVSLTGVTGARDKLPPDLEAFVSRVRTVASAQSLHSRLPSPFKGEGQGEDITDEVRLLPLCVGFGISTPQQAKQIARIADGVIIGSQIIHLMESDPSLVSLQKFVAQVREALDKC